MTLSSLQNARVGLIFGALLVVSCAHSKGAIEPIWVDTGTHPDYTSSRYVTALGTGEYTTDADQLAYLRLAEQLKVNIKGSTEIAKSASSVNEQQQYQEDVALKVVASVDIANITGVRILERYHDTRRNIHYSFAVLDRSVAASSLAAEITELQKSARDKMASANRLIGSGDPSAAFRDLFAIDASLPVLDAKLAEYSLFARAHEYAEKLANNFAVKKELDGFVNEIARNTYVAVLGAETQRGAVGRGVADPFQLQFYFGGQPETIALTGIPVRFETQVSDIDVRHDSTTNDNGVVTVRVNDIAYTGDELNEIQVGPSFQVVSIRSAFPTGSVFVQLPSKTDISLRLVVRIDGADAQAEKVIEDGVKDILVGENYDLVTGRDARGKTTDFTLEVDGRVAPLPGVGRLKFATIAGSVKLYRTRDSALVNTLVIDSSSTKGGGLELGRATFKSAQKFVESVRAPLIRAVEQGIGRDS